MKIPAYILNEFDSESEDMAWGEIAIKAVFHGKAPEFFLEKNTSKKYPPIDAMPDTAGAGENKE